MPPKSRGKSKKGKGKVSEAEASLDDLVANFARACTLLGFPAEDAVKRCILGPPEGSSNDDDDGASYDPESILLVRNIDECRPAICRALCMAMMGKSRGMLGGTYKQYEAIIFDNVPIKCVGVQAVSEILLVGATLGITLKSLGLSSCGIAESGCSAIGEALGHGKNSTLTALLKLQSVR